MIGLGPNREGTDRAKAIMDESIDTIADLANVKTLCSNAREPGGTIDDPTWESPRRGAVFPRIPKPGQSIPTTCEQRLTLAAYGAKC